VTAGIAGWTQEYGASSRHEFNNHTAYTLGTTRILHRAIQNGMFVDSVYFYTIRTLTKTSTVKGDSRL